MSETQDGSQGDGGRRRLVRAAVMGCVAVALAWGVRELALRLAVERGLSAVRAISDHLPESTDAAEKNEEDLLFPLWPIRPEALLPGQRPSPDAKSDQIEDASAPAPAAKRKVSGAFIGPTPKSSRAPVALVLQWAEHQIVPRGITRGDSWGMPAGIELHDVGALGLDLRDGDRLVTVDGISVLERSQVVGAVLGARSRRAETMTAGLVRRTKEGPVHFTVVVEQPYPEHVPDPSNPRAEEAPNSEEALSKAASPSDR